MSGSEHPPSLVPAPAHERLFDLEFAPYRPQRPLAGKARGEGLLWAALAATGQRDRWEPPLRAIQAGIGRGRAIWGAIARGAHPTWELRLANPDHAPLIDPVRQALAPWIALTPTVADDGDYDILRFTLDPATPTQIDELILHRRAPTPGEHQLWRARGDQRIRAGSLLVVDAKPQIAAALARIKASAHINFAADRRLLGRVLIPELFACRHLHVCERPDSLALTFSGVNIEQLAWFLARFERPRPLREFVAAARDRLDHLLFDVGLSYRQSGAAVEYPETAFYGTL